MSPLAFGIGKSRGTLFDPAVFYCNYLVFNHNWTDGKDLDLIASFLYPNIDGACGSRQGNEITNAEGTVVYMKWGGDNTEDTVGYESIYIDVPAIKQIPGFAGDEIELDLRAIWYSEVGQDPVIVTADGYQDGNMLLESETPNVPGYGFLNPTSTRSYIGYKETNGKQLQSTNREDSGQRLTRAKINLNSYSLTFVEDD